MRAAPRPLPGIAPSPPARAAAVALVVLLTAGTLLAARPAAAQAGPAVTVTPAEEIVDGQFVTVTWTGFAPDQPVNVRQCRPEPGGLGDCATALANGLTRDDGTGSLVFQVLIAELSADFACDYQNPCSIAVMPDTQGPEEGASAPITFAFPPSACPPSAGTLVTGSGASSINRAMGSWLGVVCRDPYQLGLDYTLKNSVDGRRDFVTALVDYAATALPLSAPEVQQLEAAGRTYTRAPASASGLVFAYNVRDLETGERVRDLVLTPELLARIFSGQILNWNNPEILALNPDHPRLPPQLRAVGRADNSAATYWMTSWLQHVAPEALGEAAQAYQGWPTEIFPSTGRINLRTGAEAVALEIARPSQNSDLSVFGYIGWMDSSTAEVAGLPTVTIRLEDGDVRATPETIAAAVEAMVPGPDGWRQPDFDAADEGTYPVPMLTSLLLPTTDLDASQAATLRGFLDYLAGDAQGDALPAGYGPLPEALRAEILTARDAVPAEGAGGPTASPSPTPAQSADATTPSPAPGTAPGGGVSPGAGTPTPSPSGVAPSATPRPSTAPGDAPPPGPTPGAAPRATAPALAPPRIPGPTTPSGPAPPTRIVAPPQDEEPFLDDDAGEDEGPTEASSEAASRVPVGRPGGSGTAPADRGDDDDPLPGQAVADGGLPPAAATDAAAPAEPDPEVADAVAEVVPAAAVAPSAVVLEPTASRFVLPGVLGTGILALVAAAGTQVIAARRSSSVGP